MSNAGKPESDAFAELEIVTRNLAEAVSTFRLRAQRAEAAQADMTGGELDVISSRKRIIELEAENQDLKERVEEARRRVDGLLARLTFLEDQLLADGAKH